MSRLWSTLKSVVGGTVVKDVEPLVSQAAAAVSVSAPAVPEDGIFRSLATVKPHVPLIKFRKGLVPTEQPVQSRKVESVAPPPSAPATTPAPAATGRSLEWWEMPAKYRRPPIDDLECEAINMGAREKPFC